MCGRTALTLSKQQVRHSCAFRPTSAAPDGKNPPDGDPGKKQLPDWRDLPCSPAYQPGWNLPPGTFLPVLYADPSDSGSRLISTMKWGLVPSWVGPDSTNFSLHMSNARVETLMEKASFRNLVRAKRRRCALLCEGFYEWKRPAGAPKQAFFFHPTDSLPVKAEEQQLEEEALSEPPTLMFMAALFDVHKEMPGQPDLFSFTVITVASSQTVGEVHDRMPALLQTPEQIATWLQSEDVNSALECLKPTGDIGFYPVSSRVNSTKNNDELCLRPVELTDSISCQPTLHKWLPSPQSAVKREPEREQPSSLKQSPTTTRPSPSAASPVAKKPRRLSDTGLTRWLRTDQSGKKL